MTPLKEPQSKSWVINATLARPASGGLGSHGCRTRDSH